MAEGLQGPQLEDQVIIVAPSCVKLRYLVGADNYAAIGAEYDGASCAADVGRTGDGQWT